MSSEHTLLPYSAVPWILSMLRSSPLPAAQRPPGTLPFSPRYIINQSQGHTLLIQEGTWNCFKGTQLQQGMGTSPSSAPGFTQVRHAEAQLSPCLDPLTKATGPHLGNPSFTSTWSSELHQHMGEYDWGTMGISSPGYNTACITLIINE